MCIVISKKKEERGKCEFSQREDQKEGKEKGMFFHKAKGSFENKIIPNSNEILFWMLQLFDRSYILETICKI